MNNSLSNTLRFIPLAMALVLFFSFVNVNAQRLEIHAIKDLSTNEIVNKAWGVGGALDIDQLVDRVTFRLFGDWSMYRNNEQGDTLRHNFQRISAGVSGFYKININKRATFNVGVMANYTLLRHSYRIGFNPISSSPITLLHTGNFIGVGAHLDIRYELTSRVQILLNFVPTYLIPISYKVSDKVTPPEYDKGIWMFPLQVGFSFLLYKPD